MYTETHSREFVCRNGVVLGLSKVARLAKMFARRLQNQHRFTQQLLEAFNAEVDPQSTCGTF